MSLFQAPDKPIPFPIATPNFISNNQQPRPNFKIPGTMIGRRSTYNPQSVNGVIGSNQVEVQREKMKNLFKELISIVNKNFNDVADNQELRAQGISRKMFMGSVLANWAQGGIQQSEKQRANQSSMKIIGSPKLKKLKSSRVARKTFKQFQVSSEQNFYKVPGAQQCIQKRIFYPNGNQIQESSQPRVAEGKVVVDLSSRLKEEILDNYDVIMGYKILEEDQMDIEEQEKEKEP